VEASARAPEDLYGLPLEEFTPARDALAKELRAADRKEEAAEVKSLRKPSLAAWALNRAARDHGEAVAALRSAGADLRAAQGEALAGDAGGLRAAGRTLADEVDRVAVLATDALRAAGRPPSAAQQEKLVATLRTAAVDDDAGDLLARGVLVDDLEATGFTLLASGSGDLSAAPPRSSGATGGTRPSGGAEEVDVGRPAGGAEDGDVGRSSGGAAGGDGGRPSGSGAGGVGTLPGAQRPAKKPKASKEALEAVEAARRELRRCDAEADLAATRAGRRAERAESAAHRAAEAQREADEARAAAEDAAGEAEAARRRAADAADQLAAAEADLPT
jgi:hypothetical protein